MKDRAFLIWIHEQLEHVHGENCLVDYMHKLRDIIKATDKEQESPNIISVNSLDEETALEIYLPYMPERLWIAKNEDSEKILYLRTGVVSGILLDCPFCGKIPYHSDHGDDHVITCTTKECKVKPITEWQDTKEEAFAAWNKRTILGKIPPNFK